MTYKDLAWFNIKVFHCTFVKVCIIFVLQTLGIRVKGEIIYLPVFFFQVVWKAPCYSFNDLNYD